MPGRVSSVMLCIALCCDIVSKLNIGVASQSTAGITTESETTAALISTASPESPEFEVQLVVTLELWFKEVEFNESYLNSSSNAYQAMYTGFNTTFWSIIYNETLLSVEIIGIRNGSVIIDLRLNFKPSVNESYIHEQLNSYIESCANNTAANHSNSANHSNCFEFGPAPNVTKFVAEDKRCVMQNCQNLTVCEIDVNNTAHCICPVGYNMTNNSTSANDTGSGTCEAVPLTCHKSAENVCLRNVTDNSTICDPCHGTHLNCNETLGQICVGNTDCAPTCGCQPDKQMVNGTCLDACSALSPCLNGGNCTADGNSFNYTCTCTSEYMGAICTEDVDECKSNIQLSKCPLNNYVCENKIPGYTCECETGFIFNPTNNTCGKVNQIIKTIITLEFEYRTNFKNSSSEDYKVLLSNFTQAFQLIYGNDSILSVDITNVAEGSIIVNLTLNFKDYAADRNALLEQYINSTCSNNSICFGLGPFLQKTDVDDRDTSCEGILCPANTACSAIANQLSCECALSGYTVVGEIGGANYGLVNRIELCQDINECNTTNNCTSNEQCVNTAGSYECHCPYMTVDGKCTPPCDSNPCGSDGECEKIDDSSYRCNCNWTHTGRNCNSALPLIFMILTCIFIVLFLLALGLAFFCFRRAQKDKLVVNDFQPLTDRTAAWRATDC